MTENNSQLYIFRRPEDIPQPPEPSDDLLSRIFVKGRSGIGYPWLGGFTGLSISLIRHYNYGIPPFAKIYVHIGATVFGYWLGGYVDHWQTKFYAERDAMMRHYISLHPEDFVEEPAPKMKYVLYPWYPRREHWDPLKGYPLR